jgi:hypothetical protein
VCKLGRLPHRHRGRGHWFYPVAQIGEGATQNNEEMDKAAKCLR